MVGLELHKVTTHKYVFQMMAGLEPHKVTHTSMYIR